MDDAHSGVRSDSGARIRLGALGATALLNNKELRGAFAQVFRIYSFVKAAKKLTPAERTTKYGGLSDSGIPFNPFGGHILRIGRYSPQKKWLVVGGRRPSSPPPVPAPLPQEWPESVRPGRPEEAWEDWDPWDHEAEDQALRTQGRVRPPPMFEEHATAEAASLDLPLPEYTRPRTTTEMAYKVFPKRSGIPTKLGCDTQNSLRRVFLKSIYGGVDGKSKVMKGILRRFTVYGSGKVLVVTGGAAAATEVIVMGMTEETDLFSTDINITESLLDSYDSITSITSEVSNLGLFWPLTDTGTPAVDIMVGDWKAFSDLLDTAVQGGADYFKSTQSPEETFSPTAGGPILLFPKPVLQGLNFLLLLW
jgi:hypothetical protein